MSKEDQYYEIGGWFFASDGCIYEYVGGDVGSKKICTMIDVKQSTFITDSMKKNAHLIAAAPKMYEMLETAMNILTGDDFKSEVSAIDIEKLLAQSRGE